MALSNRLTRQNVALHMSKVKRRSHPLRKAAVSLMMRGEVTPAEVRQALHLSRQLIYYWCKAAGIAGKAKDARKAYVWRVLLKGAETHDGPEPEHPDVQMLRARLNRPRPSREQIAAAKARHASD
jgi:hypothetical protein